MEVRPAGGRLLADSTVAQAVGMLMAAIPGPARLAAEVLSAAAARAGVSADELARAMVTSPAGTPLPTGIDRAVRGAVETAREPVTEAAGASEGSWPRLMPSRAQVEQALGRFTEARIRLTASPADDEARRAVEDAVFTLCVLMGRPSAYAALQDATQYIAD
ncbi:DUF5133 domain-containing protein [Streptomyces sp. NPDC099050]|uniref:DUF5133 domain-containing protein n=1 Tax=Streptomyces sp. NPDC099050 TaxID=3366100 RepID=UPI003822DF53